ncbi:MAG: phosphate acyltransferase PlsX [Coriobacteriia bacterium]|nr:phosphate acyltransferase PlsX [Coriobacteriia bacterium]MCL2745493.1 phosphate acyltransferase PlsX [Coriobacteriia bacterium]MCL2871194.1 phosphate acyltransferase PlsX [Coriobacteriia bacterium]
MNSKAHPVTIAVDALGGDFAPSAVVDGVALALQRDLNLRIALCGPAEVVEPFAASPAAHGPGGSRVDAYVTTEEIAMDELDPARAVRSKKDASIVVAARLVKEGAAQGFISAGSTAACLAAGTLIVGRIRGVARPTLAVVLPGKKPVVLTDTGANADCKPELLVQFAEMGRAYAQATLGLDDPSVALLNIGSEEGKGSELAKATQTLMKEKTRNFVGNVEGRDILEGAADVIVTDGFTGNVVLKTLEGSMFYLLGNLKKALTSTPLNKLAAMALKGSLKELKSELDPDQYGAAPLLGVKGLCLVAHGSSSPEAMANGILVGATAVRNELTEKITVALGS